MLGAHKENIALDNTSPRKMGWRPSSDRTTLMDEPLKLRTKSVPEGGTIYLCKFRPIKGAWLGQTLAAATAAPDRNVSSRAIRADWELFQDAHREKEKIDRGELGPGEIRDSNINLLDIHTADPSIGRSMKQFGVDYVNSWIGALDANNLALQKAFRPLILVDGRHFPEAYIRENEESHTHYSIGGKFSHPDLRYNYILQFLHSMPQFRKGASLEFERQEFLAFVEWLKTTFPGKDLLRSEAYSYIAKHDGTDLIDIFPFSSIYSTSVNVHRGDNGSHSWISTDNEWPNYTITDKEIMLYEADTHVTILLEQIQDPARPFRITGRQIVFSDTSKALSPAVAWHRTVDPYNGTVKRKFLTRDEINNNFASEFIGEVLDDWLGLVTLVGFLSRVREHTHSRLHLQGESEHVRKEGGQNIGAAQIPVYYNRPHKREQIARDPDGVLASIEDITS